jgi:hypothetical protein
MVIKVSWSSQYTSQIFTFLTQQSARRSVNLHPVCLGQPALRIGEVVHANYLLLLVANAVLQNVLLQALVEVGHAHRGIDNGSDDQEDRDDRETGEGLPHGRVVGFVARLVHPDELEDEIGQATNVADNRRNHTDGILATGPESSHEQNQDRDGDCGDSDPFLSVPDLGNDDKELHGKAEEKEEIELQ